MVLRAHRAILCFRADSRDDGDVDQRRFRLSTVLTRGSVVAVVAAFLLTVVAPVSSDVAASAATKTSTTVKRTTKQTVKRATKTTRKLARTTVRSVPTQVAGVTLTAPLITTTIPPAPPPTTTSAPTTTAAPTTTSAPTTTVPPLVVAPFDVVAVNERVDAVVGTTVVFSIVIAQRGAMNPIALSLVGLPGGMGATLSPNPATGLAVLRIAIPSDAVLADYPLRVIGSFGGAQAWATMVLRVTAVPGSTTTSSTTTTIDTSGLPPSFGFRITGDGKTLVTGGQVQYEIEPIYDTGYNGSIEYFVSGLPDGVWFGFSEKITTKKTVLWLSSTVAMRSGRYPFTITGVSKGLKKSGEVTLVIG